MELTAVVKSVKTEHYSAKRDKPARVDHVATIQMQDPENEFMQHSFPVTLTSADEMEPGQPVRVLVLPIPKLTPSEVEQASRVVPINEPVPQTEG